MLLKVKNCKSFSTIWNNLTHQTEYFFFTQNKANTYSKFKSSRYTPHILLTSEKNVTHLSVTIVTLIISFIHENLLIADEMLQSNEKKYCMLWLGQRLWFPSCVGIFSRDERASKRENYERSTRNFRTRSGRRKDFRRHRINKGIWCNNNFYKYIYFLSYEMRINDKNTQYQNV